MKKHEPVPAARTEKVEVRAGRTCFIDTFLIAHSVEAKSDMNPAIEGIERHYRKLSPPVNRHAEMSPGGDAEKEPPHS
jgi:hypothetical protein